MLEDEDRLESVLRARGLTAPRVTPQDLDAAFDPLVEPQYHQFPGTTVTVCALTCRNGYVLVGKSAAVSWENFDANIGREVAYKDARNQLSPLLGFALRERLVAEHNRTAEG